MPQQDKQFDLDKILARTTASALETLRATTDIEQGLRKITATVAKQTQHQRTRRVVRRCVWPTS